MGGIKIEGVSKVYKNKKALDNVSIDIKEGTFVCLLGPTGSGKTTLLKILAGVEMPSSGKIYFDNTDITTLPSNKRSVSMVFENFALYPNMSVFQNIASPLNARRLPKADIEKKVTETATFLKIDRLLQRRINQLSGGEMQRVAIARALCKEAKLILFDEIFVNLDYKLREQMRIEFKELMDRVNLTSIFSTPDPEDAFMLADKVAIIHDGQIRQYDSKDVVYNQPIDIVTGAYFGHPEMNMVECEVTKKNGDFALVCSLLEMPILNEKLKAMLTLGRYSLGIRPEHIQISEQGCSIGPVRGREEKTCRQGKIFLTEVVGSDTIVHVSIAEESIEVFTPGICRLDVGTDIFISFDPQKIYLFDKSSGQLVGRGA